MTIAANILNAIGGAPYIDHPSFIPAYPCPLPMNIDNGLVVGLEKYSETQLKVFMDIECPEDPLLFPRTGPVLGGTPEVKTIGQFYQALKVKIEELAPERLPGDVKRQVTSSFFAPDVLFPILTKTDVKHAINVIVEQGEGTAKKPTDQDGEIAHYYRFEELFRGEKLDPDGDSYIFDKPINIDENDIWPLTANTKSENFPAGTQERKLIDDFNLIYTRLLKSLHISFNGKPENINSGLGLMYDLKLAGQKLASLPNPNNTTETLGPSFEYFNLPVTSF
jgi:hypothetical protein